MNFPVKPYEIWYLLLINIREISIWRRVWCTPLVDFVVFCCHSVHISESKPLHDDSLLRKMFSLFCSTIFHWKIVQINCFKRNVYHEGERLVYVFGLVKNYCTHIQRRAKSIRSQWWRHNVMKVKVDCNQTVARS